MELLTVPSFSGEECLVGEPKTIRFFGDLSMISSRTSIIRLSSTPDGNLDLVRIVVVLGE